jgi:hypothetical protein
MLGMPCQLLAQKTIKPQLAALSLGTDSRSTPFVPLLSLPPQATILLPCSDNFVMHTVRDRIPEPIVRNPLVKRMALLIALLWACALTIMTSGAAIPIALKNNPQLRPTRGINIAVPVLSFGPLVIAMALQFAITHVYRKKIAQHYKQLQEQQQQAAAVAGAGVDQQGVTKGDDAV